jgi:DNA-binding transcriptional LysR family regulator
MDQALELWKEEHVRVVRKGHPLADRQEIHPQDLTQWGQVSFEPIWYPDPGAREDFLAGPKVPAAIASTIMVEQFCAPALIALETNSVATMPLQLLRMLQRHLPLTSLGSPHATFETMLAWGALDQDEPTNRWFRDLLVRLAPLIAPSQAD